MKLVKIKQFVAFKKNQKVFHVKTLNIYHSGKKTFK